MGMGIALEQKATKRRSRTARIAAWKVGFQRLRLPSAASSEAHPITDLTAPSSSHLTCSAPRSAKSAIAERALSSRRPSVTEFELA